jgi:hypothetical protein
MCGIIMIDNLCSSDIQQAEKYVTEAIWNVEKGMKEYD